jgi:hypothetical protein
VVCDEIDLINIRYHENKDSFCVPWQHLPFAHGRDDNEEDGGRPRLGAFVPH